jgi:hypothetical protein
MTLSVGMSAISDVKAPGVPANIPIVTGAGDSSRGT